MGGNAGRDLAGSEEKAAVFQELLDGSVQMFVSVLTAHSALAPDELERRCIGLVGSGEALSAALMRGRLDRTEAIDVFAALIKGVLNER